MKKNKILDIQKLKHLNTAFATLTAYDFPSAKIINQLKESLYCKRINNGKYSCKKYELQINNLTLNKLFISRDD